VDETAFLQALTDATRLRASGGRGGGRVQTGVERSGCEGDRTV
jgi:hypothetical protein